MSGEFLERLAHATAAQLYSASLAEACYLDDPVRSEDLAHVAAIHRARAEGMRIAAEMLRPQSALQHFHLLVEAAFRQEELLEEQDLITAGSEIMTRPLTT